MPKRCSAAAGRVVRCDGSSLGCAGLSASTPFRTDIRANVVRIRPQPAGYRSWAVLSFLVRRRAFFVGFSGFTTGRNFVPLGRQFYYGSPAALISSGVVS